MFSTEVVFFLIFLICGQFSLQVQNLRIWMADCVCSVVLFILNLSSSFDSSYQGMVTRQFPHPPQLLCVCITFRQVIAFLPKGFDRA